MNEPVATVEPNRDNADKIPRPSDAGPAAPAGEKGDSPHLPERPGGCFAQMGTVPLFPPQAMARFTYPSGSQPLCGFTIRRGVGHGGFGEVYYATSDAGKEVALKLIRRNLDVELRGIRQCLNLKHPNLL